MQAGTRHHTLMLVACFAAVYLVWGSTFLGMKVAVQQIPPLFLGGARFGFAGVTLLAILSLLGQVQARWLLEWRYWRTALVTGALMLLCANGLLCASLQRDVPTGIAALIVGSTPISMVTMDRMQTRRGLPGARVMAGMAIGLAGVATLVGSSLRSEVRSEHVDLVGALMVLASTLFWSGGSIVGRPMPQPRNPLVGSALQMIVGGALLLIVSATIEPWKPVAALPWSHPAWLAALYLAVFGSLVSFSAYMWLIRHASAAAVATYAYVNPLIAMLLGALFLGERPQPSTALAAVLIVGGVVLMQTGRRSPEGAAQARAGASTE